MNDHRTKMREAAIGWAMRVDAPDFEDWEGLTRWLEADPLHAAAFGEAALAGEAAAHALPPPAARAPGAPPRARRSGRFAGGGLIAAAIVAAIGWTASGRIDRPYAIETAPGQTRTIAVDGARIALNGDTRIALDRNHPRRATLEQGEALFAVRHDAAHPFRLSVGGTTVEDVGTRFDVVRTIGTTRLAVAEGAVLYDPAGAAVRVSAGHAIESRDGSDQLTLATTDGTAVGGWTEGRFAYRDAPLATVAADLSRASGTPIAVAPDVRGKRFSGVIALAPGRGLPPDLGALLDVAADYRHGRVQLTAKAERTRR